MKSSVMQGGNLGTEWTRERKYKWEEDGGSNEKKLEVRKKMKLKGRKAKIEKTHLIYQSFLLKLFYFL